MRVPSAGTALVVSAGAFLLFLMMFTQPGGRPGSYVLALASVFVGGIVGAVGPLRARRSLPFWIQLARWVVVAFSNSSALAFAGFLVSGLPAAW